jgi:hypothetical protein
MENLSTTDIIFSAMTPSSFDASVHSHRGRAAESSLLPDEQQGWPFPLESSPTSCGGRSVHSSTAVSLFSKDGDSFHNNFQQPIETPPTSRHCIQHETNHDGATSFLGIHPSTSRGGHACLPTQAPRLHIRPITLIKKPNMPSPLARRGAAERAYLQGQLRAESLRRRKQEQHNAERKLREHTRDVMMPIDDLNGKNDSTDGRIRAMIGHNNTLPIKKKKSNPRDSQSLATSPPTILHRSFKRSVSAVLADSLADSGVAENGNLLFFPSGVPLLDEEDEIDPHDVESQDGDNCINDLVVGNARFTDNVEIKLALDESFTDDDSPPQASTDVILQFGACDDEVVMTNPLMKKVTLRPKMNAPNTIITTPGPQTDRADHASPCESITSYDDDRTFPFPSRESSHSEGGEVLNGSESFRQLPILRRRWSHSSSPHPIGIRYRSDSTDQFQAAGDEITNASESYKQLCFFDAMRKLNVEPDHRPEQEHHKPDKKLRENSNNMPMNGSDDATDGHIQDMIDKFKSGFPNLSYHTEDLGRNYHNQYHHDTMSFATSPPTIIQKSFKRSVSAVLADSDMAENGNLLFFPGGKPLQDEEDEIDRHDGAECAFIMDTDSPRKSMVIENGSPLHEPSHINDASPSLVAADMILQLGTNDKDELVLKNHLMKTVTLRPKTNDHSNNHNTHWPQLTRIDSGVSECDSSGTQSECTGQAVPCIGCISHVSQEETHTSLLVSNASELFRQLSPDNEFRHRANSVRKSHSGEGEVMNTSESSEQLASFPNEFKFCTDFRDRPAVGGGSGIKVQFAPFSPTDRSNFQHFNREPLTSSAGDFSFRESLVETNYFTPDNSDQQCCFRTQMGERMPKLPELENVTGTSEVCTLRGERMRAVDHEAKKSESKYHTPANVEHVQRDCTQVGWMRQPPQVFPNTIRSNSFEPGTVLKEPLSESNNRTPDISEKGFARNKVGWMMPEPLELMPPPMAESDNSISHSTADVENQFQQEDSAKATPLSEFNYRTPDNTVHRSSSRIGHINQMPRLPELGLPHV